MKDVFWCNWAQMLMIILLLLALFCICDQPQFSLLDLLAALDSAAVVGVK